MEQNRHWRGESAAEGCVSRDLLEEIKLDSKFIEVIAGVRRSGKSTIFYLLVDELINRRGVDPGEILLVNFDHPVFVPYYAQAEKLDEIVSQAEILTQKKIKYVFLDEVQNVRLWEKWVKAKYDAGVFEKIFITGSNADLLEGEYISRLSGRYFARINYPFSFKEFLRAKGQDYYRDYVRNYNLKYKLVGFFDKYLRYGGFPEAVENEEKDILVNYYQTIILKDVIAGNEIRDAYGLKQTAYYLISNTAKLFSYNAIGKNLDLHESTVKEYIDHLKQAYLFEDLKKFDYSIKKQNRNPRKIYCADNGLVSQVGFNFSLNSGRFLENLVFLELKRKFGGVYYHSGEYECDFAVTEKSRRGKERISRVFQVCYNLNQDNEKREIEGVLEAMEKYKLTRGTILTHNQADTISRGDKRINVLPVWRWMIEEKAD